MRSSTQRVTRHTAPVTQSSEVPTIFNKTHHILSKLKRNWSTQLIGVPHSIGVTNSLPIHARRSLPASGGSMPAERLPIAGHRPRSASAATFVPHGARADRAEVDLARFAALDTSSLERPPPLSFPARRSRMIARAAFGRRLINLG